MSAPAALESAFDNAIRQVDRATRGRMVTLTGESAAGQLERLRADIVRARELARQQGAVDPDWVRGVVRWVADWAPETDVTLIAALGALARLASTPPAV